MLTTNDKAGITTCEREQPTLDECKSALRAAGFRQVHEYVDTDKSLGPFRNMVRLLHYGYRWIFQDDAILSANAKEYIEDTLPDDFDVAILYTAGPLQKEGEGWHRSTENRSSSLYGGLGYHLSQRASEEARKIEMPEARVAGADVRLMRWAIENDMVIYQHTPSLIKHIGVTSTVSGMSITPARQCKHWLPDAQSKSVEEFPPRPSRNPTNEPT